MTVERIDCANDPRAIAYRDLRDGDLLRGRGLFAAEGRVIVRRLIEDGRCLVHSRSSTMRRCAIWSARSRGSTPPCRFLSARPRHFSG